MAISQKHINTERVVCTFTFTAISQTHINTKRVFCTLTFTFMAIPHQAVVMTGNLVDCCEPGKLNEIGTWHKPWFFKHVQGFFETGICGVMLFMVRHCFGALDFFPHISLHRSENGIYSSAAVLPQVLYILFSISFS